MNDLTICTVITFFYNEKFFKYLENTIKNLNKLNFNLSIHVLTNTCVKSEQKKLTKLCRMIRGDIEIHIPYLLGHPMLLPYSNYSLMKNLFNEKRYSHFLYIEDDITLTNKNIDYWLSNMKILDGTSFYPSFIRVEKNIENKFVYADIKKRMYIKKLPSIQVNNNLYVNLKYPYQGMYLYDRHQLNEMLQSDAINPNFSKDEIIEKGNLGLTYSNVPDGFISRNLVRVINNNPDPGSIIIHARSRSINGLIKNNIFGRKRFYRNDGFNTTLGTIYKDEIFL